MCAYLQEKNYAESVFQGPLQLGFSPASLIDTRGRGGGVQGILVSLSPTHKQRDADSSDSEWGEDNDNVLLRTQDCFHRK